MNFIFKRNEGQKILKRNKKNNPSDEMKDKWLFRLIPSSKDIVNGIKRDKRKHSPQGKDSLKALIVIQPQETSMIIYPTKRRSII